MANPMFNRLVRFKTSTGQVCFGEASETASLKETFTRETLVGKSVRVFSGCSPWDKDFCLSEQREVIHEVLSPLAEVPIFYGIGLNYRAHAREASLSTGDYPTVFTKPPDALAGPFEDIPVNKVCELMDYEGELCVVIGKDCKDLGEGDDPTPYILGYTAGNDLSSRYWQRPERANGQPGTAKSFDKFAPIGPVLASPKAISDPKALVLRTVVNGEQRQRTGTDDLIFDIAAVLRNLSRARTLRPGTVIMTGTPSGVANFMKPPAWLKNGDVVEVEITGIGKIENRIVIEQ